VSAETGEPLPRIPVGAVTAASLRGFAEGEAVRPAARTVTDNLGAFRIVFSPNLGNAAQVYVFTADPLYRNQVHDGVALAGQFPTKRELDAVKPVNAYRSPQVAFRLRMAVDVRDELRIPMRDGTELAATAVLPAGGGRHPAVLLRTPYGRAEAREYGVLAREGYAVIIQDVRGRGGSDGEELAFVNDAWGKLQDGYDTVEWVAGQNWCNGNVGTIGASAPGILQNLLAGAAPPHLKAQVVIAAAASIYHDAAYPGGVLSKSQVESWLAGHDWPPENLALIRQHPFYGAYWERLDLAARPEVPFPPAIYVGGWYDAFAEGTLRGFHLRRRGAAGGAPGDTFLIMGPWTHNTLFQAAAGETRLPAEAARDLIPVIIAFLDCYLKGKDNAFSQGYPQVQYYVMGALTEPGAPGNFWMAADEFPPPGDKASFFLAPEGRLLASLPESRHHTVNLSFNPSDPVPTTGGRNLTLPAGPADQRAVEQRSDVISFTSEPLSRPLPIAGLVSAQIILASEGADADISVRLSDVYPDGTSYLLLDGSGRLSLPPPFTRVRSLTPGRFYAVPVELGHIAYVVNRGHRLRVSLAASNYPRYELNPALAARGKPTTLKIQLGGDEPSSLQFTVCEGLLTSGRQGHD